MEPKNVEDVRKFNKYLDSKVKSCLGKKTLTLRTRRSRMWGLYHQLRTSKEFITKWTDFLKKSGNAANPAFFQYVTYEVFKETIKDEFELSTSTIATATLSPLSRDDQSALRYVAGYVCRKIREKLEPSTVPQKNDMILTLMEFRGSGIHSQHESEKWTNLIDRGGLWHVTDDVFSFFLSMEEEIRHFFTLNNPKGTERKEVIGAVVTNEDVLFEWCMLTVELDDNVAQKLRDMIVELYVTIRGFSFSNSCMELYKQSKKKAIQKTKGTRSKLENS